MRRVDPRSIAAAADQRCIFLVRDDARGTPKLLQRHALELQSDLCGDYLCAGQYCDVFQHRLATIAEAGRLDRDTLENAAKPIDDQGRKCFPLDILGNDQQWPARFGDLLQDRNKVVQSSDLVVAKQHEWIFKNSLHALRVGDEVGRYEATIKLHALDDIQRGFRGLGLFDRNHALAADLLDGIGDQSADRRVIVS